MNFMDGKEVKEFKIPHQVFSTLFKNSKQVTDKKFSTTFFNC